MPLAGKTSEARLRGRLRWLMPEEGACDPRSSVRSSSIGGYAGTRLKQLSEIEGEAPLALPEEGATLAPLIDARRS